MSTIRYSARALILNEHHEILLQKFEFKNVVDNKVLWVTPGGEIEQGESPRQALEREIYEELGIKITVQEELTFQKDVLIHGKLGDFISREFYFTLFLPSTKVEQINVAHMTANELDTFRDLKWWKKRDLEKRNDFAPTDLLDYF